MAGAAEVGECIRALKGKGKMMGEVSGSAPPQDEWALEIRKDDKENQKGYTALGDEEDDDLLEADLEEIEAG
ncbi:hypothetical protein PR202_gb15673 [Eleusine coracana subsp. coracana]|uniref:Uncharacterized protein n=1 Tax=Eleusine coracana subsp. coracana TaxID=191504 RepID=A0AAV5EYG9_ELECO|nr:hypothetical protein PR202_gb15673 [Eleusine coracana subsp. coracana]